MIIPSHTPAGAENRFTNARLLFPHEGEGGMAVENHDGSRARITNESARKIHLATQGGIIPGPFYLSYPQDRSHLFAKVKFGERPEMSNPIPAFYRAGEIFMDFGVMTGRGIFTNLSVTNRIIIRVDGRLNNTTQPPRRDEVVFHMEKPDLVVVDCDKRVIYGDFTILEPIPTREAGIARRLLPGQPLRYDNGLLLVNEMVYRFADGEFHSHTGYVPDGEVYSIPVIVKTHRGEIPIYLV